MKNYYFGDGGGGGLKYRLEFMYSPSATAPERRRSKKIDISEEKLIFRMYLPFVRIKFGQNLCMCRYPDKIGPWVEKNYPDKNFFHETYISRGFRGSYYCAMSVYWDHRPQKRIFFKIT